MYEAIANCYDELTDAEYYKKWFEFAAKLLGKRERGIDVGCGSGAFAIELTKRGKQVTGIDESGAMLAKAMENARKLGLDVRFAQGRAEKLRLEKKVEFITAMNDVVNHIKDPSPFFKAAYDALSDGGLLLFDISTRYKLEKIIAGNTFFLQSENFAFVWENSKVSAKSGVEMRLNVFERRRDGLYERKEESFRQYPHDAENIRAELEKVGFSVTEYADLTERKPKENTQRIHFSALK